jgi:uncharacterized protein
LSETIEDLEPAAAGLASDRTTTSRGRSRRSAVIGQWIRWLHVYTSMISLLIVLFFGLTGLTLNHPSWTFGDHPTTTTSNGTIPTGFASGGNVDFLAVTEYVRTTDGVRGTVADYGADAAVGNVSFKGPGYAADLQFDVVTGAYQLTVVQQGWVGVLNDLHKGRDTGSSWKWVIDASALFLVLVAVTGLGIQLFQRKRRRRALIFASVAGLVSLVLIITTMR